MIVEFFQCPLCFSQQKFASLTKQKTLEKKGEKRERKKRTKNKEKEKNIDTGCEENTLKTNEKLKLEISTEKPNWAGLGWDLVPREIYRPPVHH